MNNARQKRTILHITPHLGGGVGRVLLNYCRHTLGDPEYRNSIISLEYANEKALAACRETGIPLVDKMSSSHGGIIAAMADAEIVLVHWWNHPLLQAFLVRETLPPCRVIFWSHISGFHAPYVFPEPAIDYPDLFVFTTPVSFDVPEISALPGESKKKFRVIRSAGGIESFASLPATPHDGFVVGYVGTVDYCKLHSSFLDLCDRVDVPSARFVVCGGPSHRQIREESLRGRHPDRIFFAGPVDNVAQYLSTFDVFGYPLAPYHYGTCEQSLVEAMAAGVAPVVMNNRTERHIVSDGVTGIVANDEQAYVQGIRLLHDDGELRKMISLRAREHALKNFSTDRMIEQWAETFTEAMRFPKRPHSWSGAAAGPSASAAQVFLESLGSHGAEFRASWASRTGGEAERSGESIRRLGSSSNLWRSETRGTPRHYLAFFPGDPLLRLWSGLLEHPTGKDAV